MIYLYVKTHKITGLKYLGQTSAPDPFKYNGSGLYWKMHIKKYGNEISTEILKECNSKDDVRYWGEYYSKLWNVVESNEWANLKVESGDGGSIKGINKGRKHTAETKQKISNSKKGKSAPWSSYPRTIEQRQHLSKINLGKTLSDETKEKLKAYRAAHPYKHSEYVKKSLRKPKSEEAKHNMRHAQQCRRSKVKMQWITDGTLNSQIPEDITIPDGWYKGRTCSTIPPSQKGKIWINNGIECKMSYDVPDGWYKGRLKINDTMKGL